MNSVDRVLKTINFQIPNGIPIDFYADSIVDAKAVLEEVENKILLMGNISNLDILLNGNTKIVKEKTIYVINTGVQIVGPNCTISITNPNENLLEIARAAKDKSKVND